MIDKAPPGPIETKWGLGFRDYDECMKYIRRSNSLKAPEGGVALPLPYTIYERPSYSVVPSNAIWRIRRARTSRRSCARASRATGGRTFISRRCYAMRGASGGYYPGLSPNRPNAWTELGVSLAHLESEVLEHLRCGGGGARVLPRDREAPARVLPGCDRCAGL